MRQLRILGFVSVIALFFLLPNSILAVGENIPVSLEVAQTRLVVTGHAAPNSQIIISQQFSTLAATTSDNVGLFAQIINLSPGIHTLKFTYTDVEGLVSSITTSSISIQPQQDTALEVLLPPVISLKSKTNLEQGEQVILSGRATPTAIVRLYVNGQFVVQTVANPSGHYLLKVNSVQLPLGADTAYTSAEFLSLVSQASKTVTFHIDVPGVIASDDFVVYPALDTPPPAPNCDNGQICFGVTPPQAGSITPRDTFSPPLVGDTLSRQAYSPSSVRFVNNLFATVTLTLTGMAFVDLFGFQLKNTLWVWSMLKKIGSLFKK